MLEEVEDDAAPVNVIDAAATGASSGLSLALNVGAMLLAFVALIAVVNGVLGGVGGWFGMPELTLELLLGWAFSPLAFCWAFLGTRPWWPDRSLTGLVVNEFVAYLNFAPYLAEGAAVVLSPKTVAIIAFRSADSPT